MKIFTVAVILLTIERAQTAFLNSEISETQNTYKQSDSQAVQAQMNKE